MPKVSKICSYCSVSYEVFPCFAKTTKYCSRLCHNRGNALALKKRTGPQHQNFGKRFRIKEWATVSCKECSKNFECAPWEHKAGRRFCSKKCCDLFQTQGTSNSKRYWQRRSKDLFGPNCEKCGATERIEVHHIDRDRENNPHDGSNWMRLCRPCHYRIHSLTLKNAPIILKEEFLSLL